VLIRRSEHGGGIGGECVQVQKVGVGQQISPGVGGKGEVNKGPVGGQRLLEEHDYFPPCTRASASPRMRRMVSAPLRMGLIRTILRSRLGSWARKVPLTR